MHKSLCKNIRSKNYGHRAVTLLPRQNKWSNFQRHVCSVSRVQLLATPWTVARQAPLCMGCSGKSAGMRCHFLYLNPEMELALLHLLYWQGDSLPLSHLGSLFKIYTSRNKETN